MPTYKQALKINERYALDNEKEPSAVKLLMLHHTGMRSAELMASFEKAMDKDTYDRFLQSVNQYVVDNKPVQYITGNEYFYGHNFCVNKDVLIPRFETEELIGYILDLKQSYFKDQSIKLLDVGTGSGCLAITLNIEDPTIRVHATDISKEAIAVAQKNNHDLNGSVVFHHGDLLEPVKGETFDMLISNPPYIPNDEFVEALVKDNEPHIALFGGDDGLEYYRRILQTAESVLNDRYIIAFEHAYDKAAQLKKMVKKYLKHIRIIQKKDMQGKDRMMFILKK